MKFVLLGCDDTQLAILRALRADTHHRLVAAVGTAEEQAQVQAVVSDVRWLPGWEDLLTSDEADVVLVARGDADEREEPLRRLVQAGRSIAFTHPVVDSMLLYYELDMIRRETGAALLPLTPELSHPWVERLILEAGQNSAGTPRWQQVVIRRTCLPASRAAVLDRFTRDMAWVQRFSGELNQALASRGSHDADLQTLQVQLEGTAGCPVRWQAEPPDEPADQLELLSATGRTVFWIPRDGNPWRSRHNQETVAAPDWDVGTAALAQCIDWLNSAGSAALWTAACRGMELKDGVERSLARGRRIELHYDEHTEEETFKGIMSGLGCGLLLGALACLVVCAVVAHLFNLPFFGYAPYLILAILGGFLLLQTLRLAFPVTDKGKSGES